ncbi:MAG: hypothetical protein AAF992_20310 [Bacteroidota bacterium]
MDQHLSYSEQVDLYLKGKLSDSERVAFEEKIQQDPLLQSEMKLQQEIHQALSETRKVGLKSRLDQVPIEQTPWFIGSTFKTAAVVSALVITSVATYVTFAPTESEIPYEIDIAEGSFEDYATEADLEAPKPLAVPEQQTKIVETAPVAEEATASQPTVAKEEKPMVPTVQRPSVTSDFSEDPIELDYSDFEAPQKQALQNNTVDDANIAVKRIADTDHTFHYQFYDDKLFLHGNFEDAPYKVIAFNAKSVRRLFLEHAGQFYQLQEQEEIVPLVPITDSTLVKELRNLSAVNSR